MSAQSTAPAEAADWQGEYVRYDLVKEFVIALAVITALAVILTVLFSSPDDPPTTIQQWARADPGDFLATATTELDRIERGGDLRPPLQPHARRGAEDRPGLSPMSAGSSHPDRHR